MRGRPWSGCTETEAGGQRRGKIDRARGRRCSHLLTRFEHLGVVPDIRHVGLLHQPEVLPGLPHRPRKAVSVFGRTAAAPQGMAVRLSTPHLTLPDGRRRPAFVAAAQQPLQRVHRDPTDAGSLDRSGVAGLLSGAKSRRCDGPSEPLVDLKIHHEGGSVGHLLSCGATCLQSLGG